MIAWAAGWPYLKRVPEVKLWFAPETWEKIPIGKLNRFALSKPETLPASPLAFHCKTALKFAVPVSKAKDPTSAFAVALSEFIVHELELVEPPVTVPAILVKSPLTPKTVPKRKADEPKFLVLLASGRKFEFRAPVNVMVSAAVSPSVVFPRIVRELAVVVVPEVAPRLIVVAAPPIFSVVAVVFIKLKVVAVVVISPPFTARSPANSPAPALERVNLAVPDEEALSIGPAPF